MISWANDDELFEIMKTELYTAVVGDILDTMHYYHQFLPQKIQPMSENMIVAGRAMPVAECDIDNLTDEMKNSTLFNQPLGLMIEALDDLKKNEVYICSGASPDYALVGEIMCTRMKHLCWAGAVVNGFHRDTKGILAIHFPCFSYGRYSQDQAPRGKVVAYRVPIEIDGVKVNPGDIVFGDLDGAVMIPQEVEKEVIEKAYEKATGEKTVGNAIRDGMSAKEDFTKYGIM